MLSPADGKKILRLARDSITCRFTGITQDLDEYNEYSEKQGAFVTLHKDSLLRGCIGYPEPVLPLCRAIAEAACSAAFDDPRFPPLEEDELDMIKIEISVLSVPRQVLAESPDEYQKKIRIGRDGLIIRNADRSGLLLPQVPVEQGWDVDEYLHHICLKAGMPSDAWKDLSNRLYSFQAQIFSE